MNPNQAWLDDPQPAQRILFDQSFDYGLDENPDSAEEVVWTSQNHQTGSTLGRISEDVGKIQIERDQRPVF